MDFKKIVGAGVLFLSIATPALAAVTPPPLPTAIANGTQAPGGSNQTLSKDATAAGAAAVDALNGLAALAVAAKNNDRVTAGTAMALVKESAARAKASAALAVKRDTTGGHDAAIAQASADRAQKALTGAQQIYAVIGQVPTNGSDVAPKLAQLLVTINQLTQQSGQSSSVRPNTFVRAGSPKGEVLKLQLFLNQKGYLKVVGPGTMGPTTIAALKAYQKAKGLPQTSSLNQATLTKMATDSQ